MSAAIIIVPQILRQLLKTATQNKLCGCLWCTIPIQKRTKYFFEGDFSSALLIVEIHHDTVIEQIDGVDKAIDDLFLKGDIRRVAVAELIEPE